MPMRCAVISRCFCSATWPRWIGVARLLLGELLALAGKLREVALLRAGGSLLP